MTAREVLLKAADHIERYGWQQGGAGSPHGPCCALGAIAAGPIVHGVSAPAAIAEAEDMLRDWIKRQAVSAWNDAPDRTAAEVIAALRGAAAGLP